MIKVALSAVIGAAIGAYAASGPVLKTAYQQDGVKQVSIDTLELTKQAMDLPVREVKEPF